MPGTNDVNLRLARKRARLARSFVGSEVVSVRHEKLTPPITLPTMQWGYGLKAVIYCDGKLFVGGRVVRERDGRNS